MSVEANGAAREDAKVLRGQRDSGEEKKHERTHEAPGGCSHPIAYGVGIVYRYRHTKRPGIVVGHNRFRNGASSGLGWAYLAQPRSWRSRMSEGHRGSFDTAGERAYTVLFRAREHHQGPTGNGLCGCPNRALDGLCTE
jgi:hypothetical protein